ncbi:MAG: hypothetical protein ACNA8H_00980 [Anaerolineales bacterium]
MIGLIIPDWEDHQIIRAGLRSGLTLLRLFNNQLEQAIRENLDEREIQ